MRLRKLELLVTAGTLLLLSCRTPNSQIVSEVSSQDYQLPGQNMNIEPRLEGSGIETLNYTYRDGNEPVTEYQKVTSPYRIWLGDQDAGIGTRPLLVFLHGNLGSNFGPPEISPERIRTSSAKKGDGGYGQDYPTLEQIRFEATTKNKGFWDKFVLLAVMAPTVSDELVSKSSGKKTLTWGSRESDSSKRSEAALQFHANYLHQLIQDTMNAVPSINRQKIFFMSQSGGSLFLSGVFLPKYMYMYRGGAVLMCGGEQPLVKEIGASQYTKGNIRGWDPSFATHFNMNFFTTSGESDHLVEPIKQGHAFYLDYWTKAASELPSANIQKPRVTVMGDKGHCLFSTDSQPAMVEDSLRQWGELP